MNDVLKRFALISLALIALLVIFGCGAPDTSRLQPVEVKDYKGEKLSSISDFQENSIRGPQHVDEARYRLQITGMVENPVEYTYNQIINDHQTYEKAVQLDCVEGWSVNILWQGILVKDLMAEAKVKPEAKIIIFQAADGYTTSLPVDYIVNNNILIAYKMNGVTLPPERGFPFELVAESKWGYKWVKWVTKMELSDDVNYRGYWEQRGYSNSGDRDQDFFDMGQ
jgi:DMSO/TMAO reductase YedYZ molybdopterin-dependent catalytic subunit